MLFKHVGMTRLGLGAFALAGMLLTASSAKAACGFAPLGAKAPIMPMLGAGVGGDWHEHEDTIVGLWRTTYTMTGGGVFNETLKQWHSDGSEFESAFLPPAAGNVCMGVWKDMGHRTVKLHHMGWLFDGTGKTTANGIFTLDEEDTVAEDGKTYTGKFTFTPYSIAGEKGTSVTGTIAATRITVD
jgi:hypothetical protein